MISNAKQRRLSLIFLQNNKNYYRLTKALLRIGLYSRDVIVSLGDKQGD